MFRLYPIPKRVESFRNPYWSDSFASVPPASRSIKRSVRNLWRDIVDGLADAVIVIDSDLKPVAVNPAAETMLGVSQVGRPVFASIVRHNEWLGMMLHDCLETGQNLGDPEATFNIGPRAVVVRVEISPLAGSDGHIGGAIVLLHDLSHQ